MIGTWTCVYVLDYTLINCVHIVIQPHDGWYHVALYLQDQWLTLEINKEKLYSSNGMKGKDNTNQIECKGYNDHLDVMNCPFLFVFHLFFIKIRFVCLESFQMFFQAFVIFVIEITNCKSRRGVVDSGIHIRDDVL